MEGTASVIQIRDLVTHLPSLEDIGPKFGLNATDNGFMLFEHLYYIQNIRNKVLWELADLYASNSGLKSLTKTMT
ncbi:hypothetical protein RclHR1_06140010 [Rhizophagus clarus]|uniref:Uncharacterized protein n=1 Tax=Rhizophagus clarus TaxID=94130 RepID=A0A2Z6RQD6_9GLOM|nr:hypothetical protein RclHR1_06140010 [Rhizophagus clarus]